MRYPGRASVEVCLVYDFTRKLLYLFPSRQDLGRWDAARFGKVLNRQPQIVAQFEHILELLLQTRQVLQAVATRTIVSHAVTARRPSNRMSAVTLDAIDPGHAFLNREMMAGSVLGGFCSMARTAHPNSLLRVRLAHKIQRM